MMAKINDTMMWDMTTAAMDVNLDFGPTSPLPLDVLRQIHVVAMVNLACSIIVSVLVMAHMLKNHFNIFKRPIGERLVFYLAFGDLCFSISHCVDHAYMLAVENNPPVIVCRILGFFMCSYFNTPCVVVVVTAVNVFNMVVLNKKISLGRYDWRLLTGAFVVPQLLFLVFACLGWVGPTGVWCGFNYETREGAILAQANAAITIIIFIVNLLCYSFIWCKLHSVAKSVQGDNKAAAESATKYHKSARVMMIFVVSYVVQYWAMTLYYILEFLHASHVINIFLAVTFTNQGGLFNFFAYTYVRKKYASSGGGGGESKVGDSSTTKSTVVTSVSEEP